MQADPMFLLQQQIMATNMRLDKVITMLTDVQADVQFMKDANRSTSTSGIKYPCPLQCGADFKKVGVRAIAVYVAVHRDCRLIIWSITCPERWGSATELLRVLTASACFRSRIINSCGRQYSHRALISELQRM